MERTSGGTNDAGTFEHETKTRWYGWDAHHMMVALFVYTILILGIYHMFLIRGDERSHTSHRTRFSEPAMQSTDLQPRRAGKLLDDIDEARLSSDLRSQDVRYHVPSNFTNSRQPALRIFQVTNGGTSVEGAFLASVFKVKLPNRPNLVKFLNPLYWKNGRCARSHIFSPGGCYWCPQDMNNKAGIACTNKGVFSVSDFRDDHFSYSLKTRGTLDMIKMRPYTSSLGKTVGKAVIDTMYASCDGLKEIPVGVPGVLRVDELNEFLQMVEPRPVDPRPRAKKTSVVCAKSFYGTGVNARTVHQFLKHYLDTWQFDTVYVYEMGTSQGILLIDIILASSLLRKYLEDGRLVYIDFRDELQRMFGPIAGDIVFFSSKNAQLLVASDCFNRAKQGTAEWLLPIDWDEILTFGKDVAAIPRPRITFAQWIEDFNAQYRRKTKHDVYLINLATLPATDGSMCEDCKEDWSEAKAFDFHKRVEMKPHPARTIISQKNEAPDAESDKGYGPEYGPDEVQGLLPGNPKYLVRVKDHMFPYSFAYGVHVLSGCAFTMKNFERWHTTTLDTGTLYLRHYRCMNSKSPCDQHVRYKLNWAYAFANVESLNGETGETSSTGMSPAADDESDAKFEETNGVSVP